MKSCSTRFDLLNETETETISGVATNQRPEQTRVMDVTRETEDTNKILSVGSARFELLIFITGRGRLSLSLFLSPSLSFFHPSVAISDPAVGHLRLLYLINIESTRAGN